MAFSSSIFLLWFLPLFLILYFLLPYKLKNWFLLLASIFFFAWSAPEFVIVLGGSIITDFVIMRFMRNAESPSRKWLFLLSVIMNLGLLVYFKYMNFFVDQFNSVLNLFGGKPEDWTRIALPVGISFITFQKLSCILEVYKKRHPGFDQFQDYALYILMFPQILSGPIVRPGQISEQITDRREQNTIDNKLTGFCRFIIGLSKKVLIADVLGVTVNEIFALPAGELSSGLAWTGAIAYTFQIYFDFSGYSDMAIGLARMIGFRLPENFNSPYLSTSITEFWRRWHMTLSLWFRDYLFLPLAYSLSRKIPAEKYRGLKTEMLIYIVSALTTFLLCGFWHGAAWSFVVWGLFHGFFIIIDRLFLLKFLKMTGRGPAVLFTFLILVIGWVIFRADNLPAAFIFLGKMFTFGGAENQVWLNSKFWTIFCIAIFFSFWAGIKKVDPWIGKLYESPSNKTMVTIAILAMLFFILNVATITSSGFNPFIYFRF
ncbi:MAG: MBOAT family O-acyltransferase [bacterium]